MGEILAKIAGDHVPIGLAGLAIAVQDDRHAGVGRVEHRLRLGDDAEQVQRQDLLHVLDAQHLAGLHPLRDRSGSAADTP